MPSLSSPLATMGALVGKIESVIVRSLLPFPALHAEPGNRDRRRQERYHGGRDRGALTEPAGDDAAVIAQRCHRRRGQLVSPSSVAASYSDGDTVCRPASKVIATKGTPRQILAKITLPRAKLPSPRKSMLWSIRPSLISDQEIIENWES